MEIIKDVSSKMLDEFYKDWSLTFEGMIEEEINLYLDFLKKFAEVKDRVFIFKGKLMNEKYNLTEDNRYPDDLNFMVIKLKDIKEIGKIAIPRFEIAGRWFTEIVDNDIKKRCSK